MRDSGPETGTGELHSTKRNKYIYDCNHDISKSHSKKNSMGVNALFTGIQ